MSLCLCERLPLSWATSKVTPHHHAELVVKHGQVVTRRSPGRNANCLRIFSPSSDSEQAPERSAGERKARSDNLTTTAFIVTNVATREFKTRGKCAGQNVHRYPESWIRFAWLKGNRRERMSSVISDSSGYLFSHFVCGRLVLAGLGRSK